ncbi:CobW family GTP-binding protein [Vreelandella olivaria]|uniref:CobW family GTP-binding protein n=1 Tax=Vreelandella olivaria TaxID=390919 RepID=UPI00201F14A5|nr:GTP-binding protein [Halomonas olivaria]
MTAPSIIPVHIITGFLGSGKTTLIHSLIKQKPVGEKWAILVNEFGQIGIDQAMFDSQEDVVVKGLPGGCLCCQLAFVLQATLVNLLARSKPDRLIIEPSGLGHPAGLLDLLRGDTFQNVVNVRDIITTLDPRRLDEPRVRTHGTFQDQLTIADAVAITMVDQATQEQLDHAQQFTEALWPARKWIRHTQSGQLPLSLLLESGSAAAESTNTPSSHQQLIASPGLEGNFFDLPPPPGKPRCETGSALGYVSTGIRWHPAECFNLDRLAACLTGLPKQARIKGVFNTNSGWKRINRADGALSVEDSAWRQDSRLEVITPEGHPAEYKDLIVSIKSSGAHL